MPTSSAPLATPAAPSFGTALIYWLKLGFISFGGPAGQIALMHAELVERKRWISEARFLHALNYCMLLPGPEAQQLATYIGWLLHRTWGGVAAGVLFVLPSLLILIGLTWAYMVWGETALMAAMLHGIKPAVTAIVLAAAHRIGTRILKNGVLWGLAVLAFLAIYVGHIAFPLIVLGAAAVGLIGNVWAPHWFAQGASAHGGVTHTRHGPALIDDATPAPAHAVFNWAVCMRVTLACGSLWCLGMALLLLFYGQDATLTQMAWFFSKAALVTFGGAYAVLPYVYQGAVEQFHWLSAAQMMDGLALGETTPGPLIMVVAFVGFVGGWSKAFLGTAALAQAGAAAAVVVTFFTFLPSFFFIFLGGPLIESTHGKPRFTAPLTAITAAVVGVIANLALFFAVHVFWPQGLPGRFDGGSALTCLAAALALLRYRVGVVPVIAAAAASGIVLARVFG